MVRLRAVSLITDDGFAIYHQSFGETEQDIDIIGSLLMALKSFTREMLEKNSLSEVDFGEGADMILESGKRIIAIAVVVLNKKHKRQEEYNFRQDLLKLVKKVEEMYVEELADPIFKKSAFSEVGRLVQEHFASYL